MGRGKAIVLAAAVGTVASASIPATAVGQATDVRCGQECPLIRVQAAPGATNAVTISYEEVAAPPGSDVETFFQYSIADSAGAVAGGDCEQGSANTVTCVDTTFGSGASLEVDLEDADDSFAMDPSAFGALEVHGGAGDDTVTGGGTPTPGDAIEEPPFFEEEDLYGDEGNDVISALAGDDFLNGGDGKDKLDGGPGPDTFEGGDGIDKLDAKDGEKDRAIDCGPGSDRKEKAKVDKKDPPAKSC